MPLSTGAAKVSQAKSKLDIVATVKKAVEASDSIDEWKAALFTECRGPSAKSLLQAIHEYDNRARGRVEFYPQQLGPEAWPVSVEA